MSSDSCILTPTDTLVYDNDQAREWTQQTQTYSTLPRSQRGSAGQLQHISGQLFRGVFSSSVSQSVRSPPVMVLQSSPADSLFLSFSPLWCSLSLCLCIWKHVCEQLKHLCVSGAGSLLDSCTLVLHTWKWWTHLLVITWFSGYERPSQTLSWCLIVELSLSLLPSTCVFALFHSINITYISFSSLQKPGGGSERDCCGERKLWINLLELWTLLLGNPFCLKSSLWLSCK